MLHLDFKERVTEKDGYDSNDEKVIMNLMMKLD